MKDPPSGGTSRSPTLDNNWLGFDKSIKLVNSSPGPKYLLIERTDEAKTMIPVSPFLIELTIDTICGSVSKISKLKNGNVLVITKDVNQARKLVQLNKISTEINVKVTEHKTLNCVKGVVWCEDFQHLSDEEIIEGLKSQFVTGLTRMKRKVNGNLIDTGMYVLTFSITNLPEKLKVGYMICDVRPFVPAPLRCFNCLHFGHITTNCKNKKICSNCAEDYHTSEDDPVCKKEMKCVNCGMAHHAFSKDCATFVKEKSIQKIKVYEKVDMREAYRRYRERNPSQDKPTFSSLFKKCNCKCTCSQQENSENTREDTQTNEPSKVAKSTKRAASPLMTSDGQKSKKQMQIPGQNASILPRTLNRRQQRTLKKEEKKKKHVSQGSCSNNFSDMENVFLSNNSPLRPSRMSQDNYDTSSSE